MKFTTTLLLAGKTATGMVVPPEVVEALGSGKRPAVRVTIGSHTYRSTVAVMEGKFMVGVSAENRVAAGVAAGDEVEVDLELDTAPREVVVPPDFQRALDANPAAAEFFATLSYSNRSRHLTSIEGAKTAETRERRIAKTIESLSAGRP